MQRILRPVVGVLVRGVWGRVEGDVDVFKALTPLGPGLSGVGAAVAGSEIDVVGERGQQCARAQAVHPDRVDLCAEHHHGGGDVEKRQPH